MPECGEKWTSLVAVIKDRRIVDERRLCGAHACNFLEHYRPSAQSTYGDQVDLPGAIKFDLELLLFNYMGDVHQVVLREVGSTRLLRIHMGYFETTTLYNAAKGIAYNRPVTHMAMTSSIEALGGKILNVVVDQYVTEGGYYCAKLRILQGCSVRIVDVRPSDGLALAFCTGTDFFVNEDLVSP